MVTNWAILEVELPEEAILVEDPGVYLGPSAFITPSHIPPQNIHLIDTYEVEVG